VSDLEPLEDVLDPCRDDEVERKLRNGADANERE